VAIPHPIPYQGSKRNLAAAIMRYFPQDAERLIEPFAGSAALSLAASHSGKVNHFVLNDINAPLIQLWDWLIHKPHRLAKMYERLWKMQSGQERAFYDRVRDRFNQSHQPYYLLYLLARCVKASVRYNANGEFNQSPDNRRKGRHPKAMRQDILTASNLLNGKVTLMAGDYRDCLRLSTPKDIVYMDPPYQGVCANRDPRYIEGVAFDEFVDTLDTLNAKHIAYLVSYDGRTGTTNFGKPLPDFLQLKRIELEAGRSSQATLLGRKATTYESLYLSPALVHWLELDSTELPLQPQQLSLFGELA
jgi:DNA adenine methylase